MNNWKSIVSTVIISLLSLSCFSQTDSIWLQPPSLSIGGFVDAFYIFDFNKPTTVQRQTFLYNHNRHNEINLNLAFINLTVQHQKYRAKITLQSGTYANDNYANEDDIYKIIHEAFVGLSLNKKNNLWFEAGIFNSHLGFESLLSIENMNYTRSISSENLPYFLTGAKLNYTLSSKWFFLAIVTNGWQRIERVPGNSLLSVGYQIKYNPSSKYEFNWSTLIGTDDPDNLRRMRYFNNFHGIINVSKKFNFIVGLDIGFQQVAKGSSNYNMWLTPNLIGEFVITDKWKTALRLEYYQDENGVMIPTGTPNGFKTFGLSGNVGYYPIPNIACRFEARWFSSEDEVFTTVYGVSSNDIFIGTSIAMEFNKKIKTH